MEYMIVISQGEISLTRRGTESCIYEGIMSLLTLYMKESLCCCLLFDRVVHPHLVYRFPNDTDLFNAVTRRTASFLDLYNAYQSIHHRQLTHILQLVK